MTDRDIKTIKKTERIYLNENDGLFITGRELQCLSLLAQGKTYLDVATELELSERTVKKHVKSMKTKFSCNNLFQLGLTYAGLNV